jgi:general secretion pathway protein H
MMRWNVMTTMNGFTLIEILVVLLIMGLFIGLTSAIVQPNDNKRLRIEAERLAQLLDVAATESRLTGKSIAWTADKSGYRFWQKSGDAPWAPLQDNNTLRARLLPEGMMITGLQIENVPTPHIMRLEFFPYNIASSFSIGLSFGKANDSVVASPTGEVQVMTDESESNGQWIQR